MSWCSSAVLGSYMLYCIVPRYVVVQCCTALLHAVLDCTGIFIPWCSNAVLDCCMPYCIVLGYAMLYRCTTLYCIVLEYSFYGGCSSAVLDCYMPYWIVPRNAMSYRCTTLLHTVLRCTTVLYCNKTVRLRVAKTAPARQARTNTATVCSSQEISSAKAKANPPTLKLLILTLFASTFFTSTL